MWKFNACVGVCGGVGGGGMHACVYAYVYLKFMTCFVILLCTFDCIGEQESRYCIASFLNFSLFMVASSGRLISLAFDVTHYLMLDLLTKTSDVVIPAGC